MHNETIFIENGGTIESNSARILNEDDNKQKSDISYGIDDIPPWYLCLFMAFQHYLTMIGAIVSIPYILCPALCIGEEDPARGHIVCTMIFVTGLVTWLQATFGCRLPLVQGGTISFLVPALALLGISQWKCPDPEILDKMSHEEQTEVWQVRMRELSGAITVSALVQVFIGYTGLISYIVRYITPLTIVPTISLVGLTLFKQAADAASQHWGIATGTILLLIIFSQALTNVNIPILLYRKSHGLVVKQFALFKLFPVLLALLIMWGVCGALTMSNVFPLGHPARTDVRISILNNAEWFRFPYPGQWGLPTVSLSGVLGMLAGVLACTVESISYYPITAKMCNAPPPPAHVINRGIGTEGLGTVLAGLWGSGNGTNTFGENVGTIGITKIGSRRVIQWASILMLLQGVISKFGAVFMIIPEPVVGGLFCIMFGMISAFGLSTLQYVNLNCARNLFILGFSIFFPLVLCQWMEEHRDVVQTGLPELDNVISVLLSTTILVGGFIGCFLDNMLPGNPDDRGVTAWIKEMALTNENNGGIVASTYDFPIGMSLLKRWRWPTYLPFMPTYGMKISEENITTM